MFSRRRGAAREPPEKPRRRQRTPSASLRRPPNRSRRRRAEENPEPQPSSPHSNSSTRSLPHPPPRQLQSSSALHHNQAHLPPPHFFSSNRPVGSQRRGMASGGAVRDVGSPAELEAAVAGARAVAVHFWASWCEASKQMDEVFAHLAVDFPHAAFLRVEAEEQPEISEAYGVTAVPYFVFCKEGKIVDTLEGVNPASLANKVAKVAGPASVAESAVPASLGVAAGPAVLENIQKMAQQNGSSAAESTNSGSTQDALNKRLEQLVNSHPVFLFMKGTPEQPRCGFSRKVVNILKQEGVEFGSFDILTDNDVREGMKKFSNWPTFPQLYCKGELLGGCDIVIAMHDSGELKDVFEEHNIPLKPQGSKNEEAGQPESATEKGAAVAEPMGLTDAQKSRLESLINSSPVMVFIKGTPEEPKCGFSGKLVHILKQENIPFSSFDILSDDEVRQGLKVLSNWPSYPQLYIKGELVGGSDIVMEMHKSGELKKVLSEKGVIPKESLEDRLKSLVSSAPVMLFMKGTPDAPRCGFSSKVVNALKKEGVSFGSFDILSDEEVRQGLKTYSNWPTFPQLYYKSELIGGCDIVLEMEKSGELKSTLSE
ncbi:Monothiol glutaredoxin-S11 [Zea mays]|uniref:Monothiol glutaredoxin-S11 n=2 Tax=Zea mays TaxID=4577 RepID=A0A3L6EI38_MAIZE|nr:Monothiol glutaredoxin-S11 [Zea mays]